MTTSPNRHLHSCIGLCNAPAHFSRGNGRPQLYLASRAATTRASGKSLFQLAVPSLPPWPTIQPFHQKFCATPTDNLQPPADPDPSVLPSSAALDADITQQEVELALPKFFNGKAVGGAGWPAELLRYAADHATMDNGSRRKVWIPAPLLTHFLNHCFHAGAQPPCISSGLVTPIHNPAN